MDWSYCLALKRYIEDSLEDGLATIHETYNITMDVVGHLQAVEKCFGDSANYPGGVAHISQST